MLKRGSTSTSTSTSICFAVPLGACLKDKDDHNSTTLEESEHEEQGPAEKEEVTVSMALENLLKDPSLSDVELVGTNGGSISAHKLILASRSEVFRTLFYGHFRESSSPSVNLGFQGTVLREIVQYCYTDTISLLLLDDDDDDDDDDDTSHRREISSSFAVMILELLAAADYFGFPKLAERIFRWVIRSIHQNVEAAWQFLAFADLLDGGQSKNISRKSLMVIAKDFRIFQGLPFSTISPSLLETILADEYIMSAEIEIFRFIQDWYQAGEPCENMNDDSRQLQRPGQQPPTGEERLQIAKSLTKKYLRLDHIQPSDINSEVEPSGLVSADAIAKMCKSETLFCEDTDQNITIRSWRNRRWYNRGPRWNNSDSNLFHHNTDPSSKPHTMSEILHCNEMKKGLYIWSIEVVKDSAKIATGLAIKYQRCNGDAVMQLIYYCNDGVSRLLTSRSAGSTLDAQTIAATGLPRYGVGSVLTFCLDTSSIKGILSVRMDGGDVLMLDDSIWCGDDDDTKENEKVHRSFLPAAGISNGGAIRFCGFDETPE